MCYYSKPYSDRLLSLPQIYERITAVIMNKQRTNAFRTVVSMLVIALCSICFTVTAAAFSGEIVSAGSITTAELDSAQQTADTMLYPNGPVNVTLIAHGKVSTYEFFPVECSAFLQYEGIVLGEDDIMNVSPETVLYDNMIIDIGKVEYVTETRLEKIPFETIEYESKTIPKGTVEIIQAGTQGEVQRSYVVKYVNGVETERAMYAENVLSLPTEQTVQKGVGGTITAADGTVYNYSYYKNMQATAYTYIPGLTTMTTATGRTLAKGIVAVDPKVIPLHTKMFITSSYGEYGYCEAEDTGGAIKGDIVDLAFMSYDECIQFGRRNVVVYILE